ncbi:MAG: T9SS type A sorting domain-containing protein [Bacteroidota bacterium]
MSLPVHAQQTYGGDILWEVLEDSLRTRDLAVSGDSTIYLVGGDGLHVWRRSDPGTFHVVKDGSTPYDVILMASNGRFFFSDRDLRMSTDYGQSTPVVVDRGEAIIQTRSGALVAATDNLGVERSTDGGDSWTVIGRTDPVFQSVFGRFFAQSPPTPELPHGRLVVVGLGGAAVSEDDGLSWAATNLVAFFGYDAEHVVYSDARGAFFTLMNGPVDDDGPTNGVVRTSTDGRMWETVGRLPAAGRQLVGRLAAGADGSLWGVLSSAEDFTESGGVYRSLDGGVTWEEVSRFLGEEIVGAPLQVEDIVIDWEGRVWVGCSQGQPGRRTNGAVMRTVEAITASVEEPGKPSEAVLGAPYPNPTTGAMTVPLVLAAPAEVRVAVVDLLGREVAVLAEGTRTAGTYALTFETAGLPAGVYVVRAAVGGVTETQRVTVAR